MMERLTGAERQIALMICVFMAIVGLVMAAAGRGDPMGSHLRTRASDYLSHPLG